MQSATTNETLFKSNYKNMSPQKLPAFNLNDARLGAKVNGSNIMMIQNFDPDHTDEPIDFERDLESNEDESADEEDESDQGENKQELSVSQGLPDSSPGETKANSDQLRFQELGSQQKKRSKNQKRKLITVGINNSQMGTSTHNSSQRRGNRKSQKQRVMDDRQSMMMDDKSKRKITQNLSSQKLSNLIIDQVKPRDQQVSPIGSQAIGKDSKGKNENVPFWQNGMPVYPGIDQIDPIFQNSTKNGNIPSSLL